MLMVIICIPLKGKFFCWHLFFFIQICSPQEIVKRWRYHMKYPSDNTNYIIITTTTTTYNTCEY